MAPLIVLVGSFVIFGMAGIAGIPFFHDFEATLRHSVAVMFLFTAMAHWGKRRKDLIAMVPPYFPNPPVIVTMTGMLEIAGAVGLLIPATTSAAALCLALLLIAMFLANIHAAQKSHSIAGRPTLPLLPRTLLQILFLSAVLFSA